MIPIRLDSIMTGIVDEYGKRAESSERRSDASQKHNETVSCKTVAWKMNATTDSTRKNKEGRRPWKVYAATVFYFYLFILSVSTSLFWQHRHDCFKICINHHTFLTEQDVMVKKTGTYFEWFDSVRRQKTVAFRYPSKIHYHIALSKFAFADTVRECIGKVPDFVILHAPNLFVNFQPF